MSIDRAQEYLAGLVSELRKLPAETEWVEFKENNDNPRRSLGLMSSKPYLMVI